MELKNIFTTALVTLIHLTPLQAQDIMFWNLENFFDTHDDGTSTSDSEFSSFGSRHWTRARFEKKRNMIAKTILWAAGCCSDGQPPELVGFAEVENRKVVNSLIYCDVLAKCGYSCIHYDSPDRRGIDVALIYRRDSLELLHSESRTVRDSSGQVLPTRNMLLATFRNHRGRTFHIMVNHHPSKFGGAKASEGRRFAVMAEMARLCDSLARTGTGPIVCMGDFNDLPDAPQFAVLDGIMENLALPLHKNGSGTIKYQGKWELIDHFLLSSGYEPAPITNDRSPDSGNMQILYPPFLLVRDNAHTGEKPFRTYSGPRYIGGVSDHLPILMHLSPMRY